MLRRISLAVGWFAAGCQTLPRTPPFEHQTHAGSVRARTEPEARSVALQAEEIAAMLRDGLGVPIEPRYSIYVLDEELTGPGAGVRVWRDRGGVTQRRIEIGRGIREEALPATLVHELTHWYMTPPWDRLPVALEEGFADFVTLMLAPGSRPGRFERYRQVLSDPAWPDPRKLLSVTRREAPRVPRRVREKAYAIGYILTHKIGIDPLRQLCSRSGEAGFDQIPPDALLASAGMSREQTAWLQALEVIVEEELANGTGQ